MLRCSCLYFPYEEDSHLVCCYIKYSSDLIHVHCFLVIIVCSVVVVLLVWRTLWGELIKIEKDEQGRRGRDMKLFQVSSAFIRKFLAVRISNNFVKWYKRKHCFSYIMHKYRTNYKVFQMLETRTRGLNTKTSSRCEKSFHFVHCENSSWI